MSEFKSLSPENKFASWLVFLFWPFVGVILAFRNNRLQASMNIIWMFGIYLGATYVFESQEADSFRIADSLKILYNTTDFTFDQFIDLLYAEDSYNADLLQPFILFTLSRFTDNPNILYAIFGAFVGYFYSRNIWYIYEMLGKNMNRMTISYLIIYIFIFSLWHINGFRFTMATHVFIYGILRYVFTSKKKYLIYVLITPLIHFSYVFGIAVFGIYYFLGNRVSGYIIFFTISLLVSSINIEAISEYLDFLPAVFKKRADIYLNEDYALDLQQAKETTNWYIRYRALYLKLLLIPGIYWIYFAKMSLIKNRRVLMDMFNMVLLLYGASLLFDSIPSMGRFQTPAVMVAVAFFAFFFQFVYRTEYIPEWLRMMTLLSTTMYCLVESRIGLSYMGVLTILGNPFTSFFFDIENSSIINFIKGFL